MEVKWKFMNYRADPNKAYEEISSLKEITPQNVVDLARNEDSVIHNDFEWNDTVAGEKYRNIQARQMIQNFVIVREDKEAEPVRALQISTTVNEYKTVEIILRNEGEYQSLLKRALGELEAFKRRYQTLTELEPIFEAMKQI